MSAYEKISRFAGAFLQPGWWSRLNHQILLLEYQRFTGSAFFVRALFPKKAVTFAGTLAEIPSSDDLVRKFSPRCGSPMFAERIGRPDALGIALGSFDDLQGLAPAEHIWVSDKQPWLEIPADLPQYAQGH